MKDVSQLRVGLRSGQLGVRLRSMESTRWPDESAFLVAMLDFRRVLTLAITNTHKMLKTGRLHLLSFAGLNLCLFLPFTLCLLLLFFTTCEMPTRLGVYNLWNIHTTGIHTTRRTARPIKTHRLWELYHTRIANTRLSSLTHVVSLYYWLKFLGLLGSKCLREGD